MNKEAFSKIVILVVIIGVVIIIGGVVVWQYVAWQGKKGIESQREVVAEPKQEEKEPAKEKTIGPWGILQSFLAAMEAHDAETVDKLSYEPLLDEINECIASVLTEDECWAFYRGAMVAAMGERTLKEDDFTNVREDKNQAIMSTEPFIETTSQHKQYCQTDVYFLKKPTGEILILRIEGPCTYAELITTDESLKEMMIDSDNDGLADDGENCNTFFAQRCVKTNPNLKDTDGDGWWDSIEKKVETDPNNKDSYPLF